MKSLYKIEQYFTNKDTVQVVGYHSTSAMIEVVEGSFWRPISKKTGTWFFFFAENGELLKSKDFDWNLDGSQRLRSMDQRYVEVFQEVADKVNPE